MKVAWRVVGCLVLCALAATFSAKGAKAERRFIERGAGGLLPAYRVTLDTRLTSVERSDFTRPVFLFQQPLQRIVTREIRSEIGFELRLFPELFMGFVVPYSWRSADALLKPVSLSESQTLGARWLDLQSQGIGDPSVYLVVRAHESEHASAELGLGMAIPRDDNPGSNTVPTRLPLGTGQTELFAEPMLGLRGNGLGLEARYHFGLHPGNTATYLVRKIGPQSYAAGALAPYLTHQASLLGSWRFWPRFSLAAGPRLSVDENPLLVSDGVKIGYIDERVRYDVGLDLKLEFALSPAQTLELAYRHWLLQSWQQDPFFPIQLPSEGLGVVWRASGF